MDVYLITSGVNGRDTGVIVLFNSSVECTDCTKSMNLTALEDDVVIPF